jgi:hypothetical protein
MITLDQLDRRFSLVITGLDRRRLDDLPFMMIISLQLECVLIEKFIEFIEKIIYRIYR